MATTSPPVGFRPGGMFQSPYGDSVNGDLQIALGSLRELEFQSPYGDSVNGDHPLQGYHKHTDDVSVPLRGFSEWRPTSRSAKKLRV